LTAFENALVNLESLVEQLPVVIAAKEQAIQAAATSRRRKILAGATLAVGAAAVGSMYVAQTMMGTEESSN